MSVFEWTTGIVLILSCYLLGSVPFGYLLVRWTGGIDIRTYGSGNIGATNVQRYLGPAAGGATLLLDAVKGSVAVWGVGWLGPGESWVPAAVFAVVLGHTHSVYLRFRGGKGVATGCGAFLVLCPWATLAALVLFLAVAAAGRIVALASGIAALALPVFAAWWYGRAELITALIVGALVLFRHRSNFRNLWHGREERIGESGPGDPVPDSRAKP